MRYVSLEMAHSIEKWYTEDKAFYDYVNGLGLECLYKVGKAFNDQSIKDWVRNRFELFFEKDGSIKGYDLNEFSMDQISPGKVFFDFYAETGDKKYKDLLDLFYSQLMKQPRTPSGGFWHKQIYPNQMWLDGLYMQGSFYVRYASLYGDLKKCLDDLVYQFELIYKHTAIDDNGLLRHAWDESKAMAWADKETGVSKCVWGRAMGWYVMALVDVLDYIPDSEEYKDYRDRMIKLASSLVAPIMNVQDSESGLWYQVMDRGKTGKNYLESSSSSMFVYFLAKMYRKGYMKDIKLREAAEKGYNGLVNLKISKDENGLLHLNDICRGAGLGKYYPECPFRDGTFEYYTEREPIVTDNLQGVGPFLLACLEIEVPDKLK